MVHYYGPGSKPETRGESLARYVWRKHHGDIPPGMDVDHIDGDFTNDAIENLQLLTHSENAKKAWRQNPQMVQKLSDGLRAMHASRRAARAQES